MEYIHVSDVLKETFGQKIYRLSLQSGCSCPNRDGTLGTGGCTFCSEGGSGDFAAPLLPIDEQIRLARKRVDAKLPASIPPESRRYVAYFQSYTNTYGDTARLRVLYLDVIRRPEICLLSIGTRPDCLDDEKISMLMELNRIKPVWVELGLQTARDDIAEHILRGYH
ncbi:MAG: TIGR01212 family radical SAM protein, partial [Oribacterium sp.]|nr:TIGR01212 family radical SAM protein [Oribacterium sp.]